MTLAISMTITNKITCFLQYKCNFYIKRWQVTIKYKVTSGQLKNTRKTDVITINTT